MSSIEQLGISTAALAARGLREYREAEHLYVAEIGANGKEHFLIPVAATAWRNLKSAAHDDQIVVFIVSGFRSIKRQTEIVRRKLNAGACIEDVLKVCAPPGYSEHHTGCAVDLATTGSVSLEISFEETPAFRWLQSHANGFGFYLSFPKGNTCGYQYEPWHWCYRGS
jgi:D-alanyl-D-alanine carboxypeptidase